MKEILNPEKINHYVEQCLGERKEMQASELPLSDKEDFVKIIYVRLYGQRKDMKYGVERGEEGEEKEINGFRFKDFKILRK